MKQHQLSTALHVLEQGGLIAYPTDTTYGIGCDAGNEASVQRIFELKGRDFSKPMSLAFADIGMLSQYAEISSISPKFLDKIFPGPVTLLLPKKTVISDLVTASSQKVGVRIPAYPMILDLIAEFGKPIITTSANFSGSTDPVLPEEVELPTDFVIIGRCEHNQPSTIIDYEGKTIVRPGVNAEYYRELVRDW